MIRTNDSRAVSLFGEDRTAEAFVPLPDNRSIPVTLTGGAPQPRPVIININAIDTRTGTEFLIRNRHTISGIFASDVETTIAGRQRVQRVAQ